MNLTNITTSPTTSNSNHTIITGNLNLGDMLGKNIHFDPDAGVLLQQDHNVKGKVEPLFVFMSRYIFLVLCFMAIIFVLMVLMLIIIFYCMSTSMKIQARHR